MSITGSKIPQGHFSLFSSIADGDNTPSLTVVNEKNGETLVIPGSFWPILQSKAQEAHKSLADKKNNLEYHANDPMTTHKDQLKIVTQGIESKIVLKDANLAIEGTPVLKWQPSLDVIAQSFRYGSSRGNIQEAGWRLTINDDESTTLGFAKWDDAEGVKSLVKMMQESDSVGIVAAMINPQSAEKRAQRQSIAKLAEAREIPKMGITKIQRLITENNLDWASSAMSHQKGRLGPLQVAINGKKITLAVGIDIPKEAILTRPVASVRRASTTVAQDKKKREAIRGGWERKLVRALKGLDEGWRVIDLPSSRYHHYGNSNSKETIWITRIPPEMWAKLDSVAKIAAVSAKLGATFATESCLVLYSLV